MSARFGPAGNSDSFSARYKSTVSAPEYLHELGLDHYEYQCGRGVRVSDKLAADLEVKLTGTTAYEAVMCMVDAGIFKDYEEYQEICEKISYDHEKMRAGVFTFKKGTTKEDIIKEVNWS